MIGPARTDTSVVGRWWWTVDRWTLGAIGLLMLTGLVLVLAASPPVAERLGYAAYHFVGRQTLFLLPAAAVLVAASMLAPQDVRRVALAGFAAALAGAALVLLTGAEINGAHRWLNLGGWWVQPSELLKPTFVVVTAWLLAAHQRTGDARLPVAAVALLAVAVGLVAAQPDYGMAALILTVWLLQFFLAGMPLLWVGAAAGAGAVAGGVTYAFVPHVAARIDHFLDPSAVENYQVRTALNAFAEGGPFGVGPGEGVVKAVLPDAHTDFIFAVAGEEFGMIVCIGIAAVFAFVVLRGFARLLRETDYFVLLAGAGLLAQFGLQAAVNMGVNLRLLPAKGMTLPFLSYGGSSLLALALGMGMLLALTRRRAGARETRWILGSEQS